ncbi:MAG: hypothetical protein IT185_07155, partial [Acidobacteria bacterium]|nr:hypothetical protein [Acidobacteriota bacterium]
MLKLPITALSTLYTIVALTISSQAFAQPATPQDLKVHRADTPVKVDGSLDESVWQQAASIPLRYEWFPGNNTPVSVAT